MTKVLFVCLGNICRSPLAEGLFRKAVDSSHFADRIICDSCGTSNYHIGELPDSRTRENAWQYGLELSHRARQFSLDDFHKFDFILAMDRQNLSVIQQWQKENTIEYPNLSLMREFDPLQSHPDVPDPYFGGPGGFQEVFDILARSSDRLLQHVISEIS